MGSFVEAVFIVGGDKVWFSPTGGSRQLSELLRVWPPAKLSLKPDSIVNIRDAKRN